MSVWPPDGTVAILKSYSLSLVVVDDENNVLQARFWRMHLVSESAFFPKVAGNWTARKVQKLEHEICISNAQNIRRHFHCISSEVSKTQCQRKIRNSTSIQQDQVSAYNLLEYLHDGERGIQLCLDSCRVMLDPSTSVCTWRDYLSRNAWSWCSLATPSLHSYIYTSGCVADGEFGGRVIINRFDKHCIILGWKTYTPSTLTSLVLKPPDF